MRRTAQTEQQVRGDQPDDFINSLVADLRPVRVLSRRSGLSLAAAAAIAALLFAAMFVGLRDDLLGGQLDPMFLLSSGLFLLLGVASTFTVVEMSRPSVGNFRDGWKWAAAMAALLPATALLLAAVDVFNGTGVIVDPEDRICLFYGTGLGLGVAAALTFWLRRGAPTSPAHAGLLTGVAAGSIGIFTFGLCCPHNDIMHIGLWHTLAVLASGGLGRAIVPALVRW